MNILMLVFVVYLASYAQLFIDKPKANVTVARVKIESK
jgi:hypothetical protein